VHSSIQATLKCKPANSISCCQTLIVVHHLVQSLHTWNAHWCLWIIAGLEVGVIYTSIHTVISSYHREFTSHWDWLVSIEKLVEATRTIQPIFSPPICDYNLHQFSEPTLRHPHAEYCHPLPLYCFLDAQLNRPRGNVVHPPLHAAHSRPAALLKLKQCHYPVTTSALPPPPAKLQLLQHNHNVYWRHGTSLINSVPENLLFWYFYTFN
jgi:hypothetical protein